MAVISGFFDAEITQTGPDRLYGTEDFSAIFDGIISDGIFEKFPDSVYNATTKKWEPFKVIPSENAVTDHLEVLVQPGRAWFNGTWTLNDSNASVSIDLRNAVNPRIDGIYLKVDKDARENKIEVVKGSETNVNPVPTIPADLDGHYYYYLIARVYVKPAAGDVSADTQIVADDIENFIGEDYGTPYAKSKINDPTITTEAIIANIDKQFKAYQSAYSDSFYTWFNGIKDSIGNITADQIIDIAEMIADAWSTDYLSGGYPYMDNDCLYLSSDKEVTPTVIINFGFVTGSMYPNENTNELIVYTEEIQGD